MLIRSVCSRFTGDNGREAAIGGSPVQSSFSFVTCNDFANHMRLAKFVRLTFLRKRVRGRPGIVLVTSREAFGRLLRYAECGPNPACSLCTLEAAILISGCDGTTRTDRGGRAQLFPPRCPIRRCLNPVRPCVAMMIRSTSRCSAKAQISEDRPFKRF